MTHTNYLRYSIKALLNVSSIVILLLLSNISYGQDINANATRITLTENNSTLEQILEELSKNSSYNFYFKKEDLPQTTVDVIFENNTLEEVLEKLLPGTGLGYVMYNEGAIVIVPSSIAETNYTIAYYEARDEASKSANAKPDQTVGKIEDLAADGKAEVVGIVIDAESTEPIIGATVIIQNTELKTITDLDGRFTFNIPTGLNYINISYVGFEDIYQSIRVLSSGELSFAMGKGAIVLDEVTVTARAADASVSSTQIGVTKIGVDEIKKTPSFMGETDVVKTLILNTGVSTSGEGATGFNVRGGDVDQNLILADNGILLNSSHSLGFFSYFNTDFIKDVELYKAIMPAQFGGRLSSVLDVKTKDGDFTKWHIRGGVGPITSRLSFDGPIIKDKLSLIVGGRASYADWILNLVDNLRVKNSSIFFYDTNAKLTAKLGKKNTLVLSGYASEDEFVYNNEFGFNYTNYTGQLTLKSTFSNKFFSNFSFGYNDYRSSRSDFNIELGNRLSNNVEYYDLKERFTYSPTTKLKIDFGFSSILYLIDPGILEPIENSFTIGRSVPEEQGLESAAFVNVDYDITYSIGISAGLRYSDFRFLGPSSVNDYTNNDNPTLNELVGQIDYASGDVIAAHNNFEPRLSLRFRLSNTASFKTGYSRTVQYINQIFNSESPTPVSQWQLSNSFIEPNTSHNYSAGLFKNYRNNTWESNAEVFYRDIDQQFDYKDFANLTANANIETEILYGIGQSYGFEFSLKKKEGVVNGNLNYTYSRSERQIEGINNGNFYASNFDKPHDLSLVLNYQPNRRNGVTLNFVYASGRPTTPPVGSYQTEAGLTVPVFANRNAGRIPDYHRLDLAYTMGKGYKRDKKYNTSWTFSIYNVYARKNAYSIYFSEAPQQGVQANRLALLGSAFPSLTFNLESL